MRATAPRRHPRSLLTCAITLALAAAACADEPGGTATTATPATDAARADTATADTATTDTATTEATPPMDVPTTTVAPDSLRGKRYCEVLLLRPIDGVPSAEVYNTFPLNDCPADQWPTLDAAAIAAEQVVPLAVLNGPRYWLMDHIEPATGTAPPPVSFGGMEMILRATVDLGSVGAGEPPYTEHHVNRKTVFGFAAGSTVFELVAADGATYVMQSWSQQVDATLEEVGLAALGERLAVPAGWAYRVRTLTEPLDVVTTEQDAVVLQDEFKNTYSKETSAG